MAGLVYKNKQGMAVSLIGTSVQNPVHGTARLCVRTGTNESDIIKYGWTTNTSASKYCDIRANINGKQAYIGCYSTLSSGSTYSQASSTTNTASWGSTVLNTSRSSSYTTISNGDIPLSDITYTKTQVQYTTNAGYQVIVTNNIPSGGVIYDISTMLVGMQRDSYVTYSNYIPSVNATSTLYSISSQKVSTYLSSGITNLSGVTTLSQPVYSVNTITTRLNVGTSVVNSHNIPELNATMYSTSTQSTTAVTSGKAITGQYPSITSNFTGNIYSVALSTQWDNVGSITYKTNKTPDTNNTTYSIISYNQVATNQGTINTTSNSIPVVGGSITGISSTARITTNTSSFVTNILSVIPVSGATYKVSTITTASKVSTTSHASLASSFSGRLDHSKVTATTQKCTSELYKLITSGNNLTRENITFSFTGNLGANYKTTKSSHTTFVLNSNNIMNIVTLSSSLYKTSSTTTGVASNTMFFGTAYWGTYEYARTYSFSIVSRSIRNSYSTGNFSTSAKLGTQQSTTTVSALTGNHNATATILYSASNTRVSYTSGNIYTQASYSVSENTTKLTMYTQNLSTQATLYTRQSSTSATVYRKSYYNTYTYNLTRSQSTTTHNFNI